MDYDAKAREWLEAWEAHTIVVESPLAPSLSALLSEVAEEAELVAMFGENDKRPKLLAVVQAAREWHGMLKRIEAHECIDRRESEKLYYALRDAVRQLDKEGTCTS